MVDKQLLEHQEEVEAVVYKGWADMADCRIGLAHRIDPAQPHNLNQ